MKTLTIQGKQYTVRRSDKEGKKFKITKEGKEIHFGAKGYSISPGTSKGDNYCARSSGIKNNGEFAPNQLSRRMWKCKGKRSLK